MQTTDSNIQIAELTKQETTTYNLNGAGLQVKEIADIMGITYETVKCYMKSIKTKLGLQKDKEVTADFWCRKMGLDMKEETKRIIASAFLLIFIIYVPFDSLQIKENRLKETRTKRTARSRRNDYLTSI